MATNYPGALDSLTNPSAGDALDSPSHAGQHANANDAIEAVQAELGTNPSGSDATVAARLTAIEAVAFPAAPSSITGEQGTDDTTILAALLAALDGLGLIADDTNDVMTTPRDGRTLPWRVFDRAVRPYAFAVSQQT